MSANHTGKWVVARKPFGYAGESLSVGQVFQLKGLRNDDAIWGLEVDGRPKLGRYTEPFKGDPKQAPQCAECGARFNSHANLLAHGEARHKET